MLLFRWFTIAGIHTQTAIVINYLVCIITGTMLAGRKHIFRAELPFLPWFWPCLALGVLFIVVFSAMGQSAKVAGSALTAMASKMGLLIPVLTAVLFLGEPWSWNILPGLLFTLGALFLLNPARQESGHAMDLKAVGLLLLVFIGSGLVDAGVKLVQYFFLKNSSTDQTITLIFTGAFFTGLLQHLFAKGNQRLLPSWKDTTGGIILGLCNYGSMYTLMNALDRSGMPGTFLFPVNNLGVVMVTTGAAYVLFQEVLSRRQLVGLGCATLAILLLSMGS